VVHHELILKKCTASIEQRPPMTDRTCLGLASTRPAELCCRRAQFVNPSRELLLGRAAHLLLEARRAKQLRRDGRYMRHEDAEQIGRTSRARSAYEIEGYGAGNAPETRS